MPTRKDLDTPMSEPQPMSRGPSSRRRLVWWGMAVAVPVVIILIPTVLLVSTAVESPGTRNAQGNTVPTTSGTQGWKSVPGLVDTVAQPVLAPSNPQIMYLVGSDPGTIKRSDDGGAHWKTLPLPPHARDASGQLSFAINPANAQNVFLLLSFVVPSSATCPRVQASNGKITAYAGSNGCQIPYDSTDGGEHWGVSICVACAQPFGAGSGAPFGGFFAQGNSLYALDDDQHQHRRLFTSTDGGATWQIADGDLVAQGKGICVFGAPPGRTRVYALVQQTGYCSPLVNAPDPSQVTSPFAVWRSDDAGAHWTPVSEFPYPHSDMDAFRAVDTGGAEPTLLALGWQGLPGQVGSYARLMSTDGGNTWQPMSMQGLPDQAAFISPFRAGLSDGSLLMEVQTTSTGPTTLYALGPGSQTWHQVAPTLQSGPADLVVSSSGGHDILWAVIPNWSATGQQRSVSVFSYTIP